VNAGALLPCDKGRELSCANSASNTRVTIPSLVGLGQTVCSVGKVVPKFGDARAPPVRMEALVSRQKQACPPHVLGK